PAERSRGVLLFLHGNAGNISHRLDSIAIFRDLGLDVLIIDYRGYGRSEGRPSEQGTYLDARAAWDHLVDERGIEPGRIAVFGRSLGAAVVSHLAIDTTPAGVILESCFSSALDMARRLYPFMPARLITRLDYPATDNARRFNSPVMVIHSRHDEIIPFEMGRAVYDAAPQPKRFLEIHGDHNAGFFLSRAIYVPGLAGFLDEHLGPMPAGMADPESG
ncbi:MAG: alpha/beta fold hydrolase, partial [Xanthomonadales bacterium]|nr:alpha/beta hydrolase [Xanthomonadales bacterium]NIX13011.1 alpha/beta fold hydrolase [Xanthomonadales bacterium]